MAYRIMDEMDNPAIKYDLPLSHYLKPSPEVKKSKRVVFKNEYSKTEDFTEDQVAAKCDAWLRSQGWEVTTIYTGAIPLPNGRRASNPAKGIPDRYATHLEQKRVAWIEYKRSKGGTCSEEQIAWKVRLKACDQEHYTINSLELLKKEINNAGLAKNCRVYQKS